MINKIIEELEELKSKYEESSKNYNLYLHKIDAIDKAIEIVKSMKMMVGLVLRNP